MAITEEQKKIIESTGHYVIEFKLWFRRKCQKIVDAMKAIVEWIVEIMTVHVIPAFETALHVLKSIWERIEDKYALDYGEDEYERIPSYFPHIVKQMQTYRFNVVRSFKTIYHCRNNC